MKDKPRMPSEPGAHLVLVGGLIVEDDMDYLAGRMSASMVLRKRINS